jgi:hypothetical protein
MNRSGMTKHIPLPLALACLLVSLCLLHNRPHNTLFAADDPAAIDAAIKASGLGDSIGDAAVKDIITDDPVYAQTAADLGAALRKTLDTTVAPASAMEENAAVTKLTAAVDAALTDVLNKLPPNPAQRAAWFRAHEFLEGKLKAVVDAAKAGEKFAAKKTAYGAVVDKLYLLSNLKKKQDAVPASDNIIPPRFWRDAFDSTQLYIFDKRPLESTAALAKMMSDVATLPEGTTAKEMERAFERGKRSFLEMIATTRTTKQLEGWEDFLILFSNSLKKAADAGTFDPNNPIHVRAMLKQSAAAIDKLGKDVDAAHQAAADTGEIAGAAPGGTMSGGGIVTGGGVVTGGVVTGGLTHAAVHHERKMQHILRTHERRMYRIERIRAR